MDDKELRDQQGRNMFVPGSLGEERIQAPEVEAAFSVPVVPPHGIETYVPPTAGSEYLSERAEVSSPDPIPTEPWHLMAQPGVALPLEEAKHYRRTVTLLGIGTAATVELSDRSDFARRTIVGAGALPIDIPVFPFQMLWLRQNTIINQDIDGYTEPMGPGR